MADADGKVRIVGLKNITRDFIMKKGFNEASEAKALLWATKFEEARKACAVKDNLWSMMRAAETELWIYFSDESPENLESSISLMNETLEMARFYASQSEKPGLFSWGAHELGEMRPIIEAHAMAVTAFATLGEAMLEFRKRSYITGGYHLRSSWKTFEAARALQSAKDYPWPDDPVLTDIVTFGLGFFALAVSLIPPAYLWLAELIGFRADRDEGIAKLEAVFRSKGPSFIEAGLLVSAIRFFFLDETDSALHITKTMLEERPSSVYLCASLAGMHRVKGEVQEAMALMQRSVSLSQRYPQLHLNQGYNLSDLHWFMGEYERAIPLQRAFLSGTKRDAFRAFCGWKLVFALWMTRSKDTAEMHGLCVNVIEKYSKDSESYDRFSSRKCREFLATNAISQAEELILPSVWLVELKQFDLALTRVESARQLERLTVDEAAMLEYVAGVAHVGKSNYDVGLGHLRKACAHNAPNETWVMPYAHVALAQAALDQTLLGQCEHYLALAKSPAVDKFDFDGRQKLLVKKIETHLAKKKAAAAAQ